jgi:hypothetical protein
MEKKTGCDWSGTEKRGGVHLPGNTQKGEVVKKLARAIFSPTTVLRKLCFGEKANLTKNARRRRRRTVFKRS